MSHYAKIAVKFADFKALVDALLALGVPAEMITVNPTGVALEDYNGRKTSVMANVVVSRKFVGAKHWGCNDIGFMCGRENSSVYICDYARDKAGFNAQWLGRLNQEYVFNKTKAHYQAQGKQVHRVNDGNVVRLYVKA